MLKAALDLQVEVASYHLNGARLEKSASPLASMFHPPPYGCYATRDGHLVLSMSPLGALARALPLPALEPYSAVTWNFEAREAVARLIEPVIRERTTAEWIERLVPQSIWAAPINTYTETFADPAVRAADAVEEIQHPVAGPLKLLRFPLELSTGRAEVRRPPPMPGQHTGEILRESGYSEEDITRLRAAGTV